MQPSFVQQSRVFLVQLFAIYCLLHIGSIQVYAAPTGVTSYRSTMVRRQAADSSQPTTVTTVTQINTANGPVTETCTITLTPITVDGQPQVEEVKDCTVSSGSGSSSSAAGSDSTTIATSTVASSSADVTSTSTGGSSTTSSAAGAAATGSGPAVNGLSSVPAKVSSAAATGSASATASSSVAQSSDASAAGTGTATASSASASSESTAASASSSGTSAGATAAAAVASQAAFTLPGKKLSVLPIGLGVFAGISVIALIVVGLVTYERTKYRKAFRQRKLAEQGGAMGYGGMVERT